MLISKLPPPSGKSGPRKISESPESLEENTPDIATELREVSTRYKDVYPVPVLTLQPLSKVREGIAPEGPGGVCGPDILFYYLMSLFPCVIIY